jgi:hypothetical protein
MSWDWIIKFELFGWAILVPNLADYPDKKERLAIGKSNARAWTYFKVLL